jgi:hypothetical protein
MSATVESRSFDPPVDPPAIMPSVYGPTLPVHRARDLPGIVSLPVRELFPDIPPALYGGGPDVTAVREAAEGALDGVDMSMIQPGHSVNVLCSEHGFGILGGHAYAEMLGTIRDVIVERTGATEVRLIVVAWLGRKEPEEFVEYYGLGARFDGKTRGAAPLDHGIEIQTALGPLYGLRKVYDADWIVHTHYDDPREVYFHRAIDRITKPFGMSYARMETRSIFHLVMGPRTGNFIGRAIADSPFVQSKLALSVSMLSSPDGIRGVDADNDLDRLGARVTANMLAGYGKMLTLLRMVDEVIPVIDGGKWPYYNHAGGMIFGQLLYAGKDWFDLDEPDGTAAIERVLYTGLTKSMRAAVLNHGLIGLTISTVPFLCPVFVANPAMAEAMRRDFSNSTFMDHAVEAPDLFTAVEMARERGDSDNVLCFDGTYGSMNLSPSMAQHLLDRAPAAAAEIDGGLLDRWMRQRGLDPALMDRP